MIGKSGNTQKTLLGIAAIGLIVVACEMTHVESVTGPAVSNGTIQYSVEYLPDFTHPKSAAELNRGHVQIKRSGDMSRRIQIYRYQVDGHRPDSYGISDSDWKPLGELAPDQVTYDDLKIEPNYTYYYRFFETSTSGKAVPFQSVVIFVPVDYIVEGLHEPREVNDVNRLLFTPNSTLLVGAGGIQIEAVEIIGAPGARIEYGLEAEAPYVRGWDSISLKAKKARGSLEIYRENPIFRKAAPPRFYPSQDWLKYMALGVDVEIEQNQDFHLTIQHSEPARRNTEDAYYKRMLEAATVRVRDGKTSYLLCNRKKVALNKFEGVFQTAKDSRAPEYIFFFVNDPSVGIENIWTGNVRRSSPYISGMDSGRVGLGNLRVQGNSFFFPFLDQSNNGSVFHEFEFNPVLSRPQDALPDILKVDKYKRLASAIEGGLKAAQIRSYTFTRTNTGMDPWRLEDNVPEDKFVELMEKLNSSLTILVAYCKRHKISTVGFLHFDSRINDSGSGTIIFRSPIAAPDDIIHALRSDSYLPDKLQQDLIGN